jgi:hypothetical protein
MAVALYKTPRDQAERGDVMSRMESSFIIAAIVGVIIGMIAGYFSLPAVSPGSGALASIVGF